MKAGEVRGQLQLLSVVDDNEETSFIVDYPLSVRKPQNENPQEK